MSRANPIALFAFGLVVLALLGGAGLVKGGLYIAKHEGDTLHLMQIVLRMAAGEWPHLDFMTPIGGMAFWPIAGPVRQGYGIGQAFLWGQVSVAMALLLPAVWLAWTRLNGALSFAFVGVILVFALALVHGQSDPLVSVSMHYNRWAWVVSYLAVVAAVLPARDAGPSPRLGGVIDGVIAGFGLAWLALLKATYAVAFGPVVILALLLRRAWPSLGVALFAVGFVFLAVSLAAGWGFWAAYWGDLLAVAGSEVRPKPGLPLQSVVGAPAMIGGSIAALYGVICLRQAGAKDLGLLVFLLLPGFAYVTFQNFGNDPQWLILLAILLLAAREVSVASDRSRSLAMTALVALAFAAPSFLNLAYSPLRHLGTDPEDYTPILARDAQHGDVYARIVRANRVDGVVALDGPGSGLEARRALVERDAHAAQVAGEALPECELQMGVVAWMQTITGELERAGFSGARIFAADLFVSHWLFGDVERLAGGAPWYYGGLPGLSGADYVLVPLCPASLSVRAQILEEIAQTGRALDVVHRAPLFILAELGESAANDL